MELPITIILNLDNSLAKVFVKPSIANFDEVYTLLFSLTLTDAMLDKLIILPYLFFFIIFETALVIKKGAFTLILNRLSNL